MTTFFLIRHATTDAVGRAITGRKGGVRLNEEGRRQVRELCDALADRAIRRVYCSPLERARETAGPLAERIGAEVVVADELNEIDFGDWTGRAFEELDVDPRWRLFNMHRSGTRIPNGESMLEAQARIVGLMQRLRDRHCGEAVALVSHADVIRAALLFHLGIPLDLFARIEISPAAVSVVRLSDDGATVLALNARVPAWE